MLTGTTTEPGTPPIVQAGESSQGSSQGSSTLSSQRQRSSQQQQSPSKLIFDEEVLKDDTLIISTYVKEEMYYGVKFIYDPKQDLAVGGRIFKHFQKTCRNRLEGLKKYGREDKEQKELYVRYLWRQALDERVQQDALSTKRSSVYTVMQNRFFCK